jgi:flagellar biosynthesis chaperone FliJ
MMQIDPKYQPVLLEALEELMYQLSLQLEAYKGKPLDRGRKELTSKQRQVEKLQHLISTYEDV